MTLVKFRNGNTNPMNPLRSSVRYSSPLFNDILNDFFGDSMAGSSNPRKTPLVNVEETNTSYILDLAVPGYSKSDFSLHIEGDNLEISGSKKENDADKKFNKREFSFSSFNRFFNLPEVADGENISASYKDGILTVIVPKKEESVVKKKTIKIS
ncbi:MAG: HSP20 family protein [Sphingobacteriales bacterium]|jgi:HSP20 family protein